MTPYEIDEVAGKLLQAIKDERGGSKEETDLSVIGSAPYKPFYAACSVLLAPYSFLKEVLGGVVPTPSEAADICILSHPWYENAIEREPKYFEYVYWEVWDSWYDWFVYDKMSKRKRLQTLEKSVQGLLSYTSGRDIHEVISVGEVRRFLMTPAVSQQEWDGFAQRLRNSGKQQEWEEHVERPNTPRKGIQYDEGEKAVSELPRLDVVGAGGILYSDNYNPDDLDPGDRFRFQEVEKWGDAIWEVVSVRGKFNKRIKFKRVKEA